MKLTEREMEIFNDREFLVSKIKIIEKIQSQFELTRDELEKIIYSSKFKFPDYVDIEIGKIFKGENYRSLPYVVLDYPKYYSESDIFSFRTMFWWGNFFSFTLHLEGKSLDKLRQIIYTNATKLIDNDIYICVNDNQWDYHYENDNYQLLERENIDLIKSVNFLKLSKKIDLKAYNQVSNMASEFLKLCIDTMKD